MAATMSPTTNGGYPVRFDVAYPERLSRWLIFFRPFFYIPWLVAFYVVGQFILLLYIVTWFAILNDGKYPDLLLKPAVWYQRLNARASAYFALLTDKFPLTEDSPVVLEIDTPPRISRLTTFFRLFLVIPHVIVLLLLSLALYVTTLIAWFAILFTGNYPHGLFTFAVGVYRWSVRVGVYSALLVDKYPPFTLDA